MTKKVVGSLFFRNALVPSRAPKPKHHASKNQPADDANPKGRNVVGSACHKTFLPWSWVNNLRQMAMECSDTIAQSRVRPDDLALRETKELRQRKDVEKCERAHQTSHDPCKTALCRGAWLVRRETNVLQCPFAEWENSQQVQGETHWTD